MSELYLLKIPVEEEKTELFSKLHFDLLPKSVKEKISSTKDVKTKAERIYAYSLLCEILNKLGLSFKELDKSFSFDDKGKPFIMDRDIEISLSHADGMAAAAVSTDGKVGVDIEKVDFSKIEKIGRITARFCGETEASFIAKALEPELFIDRGGEIIKADGVKFDSLREKNADFVRWTALEAALKCHGGGFGALSEKNNILSSVLIGSAVILYEGNSYALSVAKNTK